MIIPASVVALVPASLIALVIIGMAMNAGSSSTQAAVPASVTSSLPTASVVQATTSTPATTAPPAPTTKAPEAPKTTAPAPAPKTTAAPVQYNAIAARDFKLLAKDPDAYAGKRYVIYGAVAQFDSATGTKEFLALTGPAKVAATDWYLLEQNTALIGDAATLSPIVEGDLFEAQVVVVGSYSYDTQNGGNTTVPQFRVIAISVYGSSE